MLALILPLPDTSRFQMPPPFGQTSEPHMGATSWDVHFMPLSSSSLKVRSDQPTGPFIKTFNAATCQPSGAFYLGREVCKQRQDHIPDWAAERATRCHPEERKRTTRHRHRGDVSRSHTTTPPTKLEAMKWLRSLWLDKGIVTTSEKYTIAHSSHVAIEVCRSQVAEPD